MVNHLPTESATTTAIRNNAEQDEVAEHSGDGALAPWSSTDLLLAQVVDSVNTLTWITAQANSKGKVPKPEPIRRPGVGARSRRRTMSIEEIKEIDPRLRGLPDDIAMQEYRRLTGRG